MSKIIYLDGTETFIFTQQLIDEKYRPQSFMSDDERGMLECIRMAVMYPNQQVVYDRNTAFHRLPSIEKTMQTILENAFRLSRGYHYEISVAYSFIALRIFSTPKGRDVSLSRDYLRVTI